MPATGGARRGLLWLLALPVLLALAACATTPLPPTAPPAAMTPPTEWALAPGLEPPPPPLREFRAAWVASVANIDWPSRRNLSVARQRAEIIAILDKAAAIGLNAIVLQVRPSADALYPSTLEPWSEYLTGEQGRAPEPFYDPLQMWITEAHRRGMDLHAWFNPFRARHFKAQSPEAPDHVARRRPDLVRRYGQYLWLDPGESEAVDHSLAVFLDVVRRYDVDGIHIDDYFYPYPENGPGGEMPFPDDSAWQRYQADGGLLGRADWRRQNVDTFIERLYREVHQIKPWVRVGISPFGLGRPDRRPPGVTGFSQYDKLYANVEGWLARGWLDYLAPQLYWPRQQAGQPFAVLRDYWQEQNTAGRAIWPGLFTSRIDDSAASWSAEEILGQVDLARQGVAEMTNPGQGGHLHFSMAALLQNRKGIADRLAAGPYREPALVPPAPWLAASLPLPPEIVMPAAPGGGLIATAAENGQRIVLAQRSNGKWQWRIAGEGPALLMAAGEADGLAIYVLDRFGRLSVPVLLAPR